MGKVLKAPSNSLTCHAPTGVTGPALPKGPPEPPMDEEEQLGKMRNLPQPQPWLMWSGGPFGSAGPVTPVGAWQVNEFDGAFKTFPITNSWAKFSYTVPAPFDSGNNCMWDTINFVNDNDAGSKCDYTFAMDDATSESDCIRQLPPTAAPTASPSMMP